MKKPTNIWLCFYALSLWSMLLLAGCSKKDSPAANAENKGINSTGNAKLTVVVSGINEVNDADDASLKASANQATPSTSLNKGNKLSKPKIVHSEGNKLSKPKIVHSGGIDAVLSVENAQKNTQSIASLPAAKTMLPASTSTFAAGFKYRLLIYSTKPDGSSPVFVSSTQLSMGDSPNTVDVSQGQNYTWFAYSYNDANDVPDVADYANPAAPTIVNRDLLFATGTTKTGTTPPKQITNNSVPITFNHQSFPIGIVLNARGMFAGINSGTVQMDPNIIEEGVFNFKTQTITNSVLPPSGTPLASSKVIKQYQLNPIASDPFSIGYPSSTSDTAKIAYFYTSSPGKQLANVKITVTDFTLTLDDGSKRPFTGLSSVFTFPSLTTKSTMGSSAVLKVNLLETPLTVNGIQWARANLLFNGKAFPFKLALGAYVFRHFPDNRYTNLDNEFWDYGRSRPDGQISDPGKPINSDPCLLVYPRGTWRMPTAAECLSLVKQAGMSFVTNGATPANGTTFGPNYIEYTATGTDAPYPSNRLHIQFEGWRVFGGFPVASQMHGGEGKTVGLWNSSSFSNTVIGPGTNIAMADYFAGNTFNTSDGFADGADTFLDGIGGIYTSPFKNTPSGNFALQAKWTSIGIGAYNIRCVRAN